MRIAVATVVVGLLGAGAAEELFINVAYVDVRRDASNLADVVGQVKQGDKVTVVERQDTWIHVKSPTVDGWVAQNQVTDQAIGALPFDIMGSSQPGGPQTVNAAKGWDEHQYAEAKSYSEDAFNKWTTQYSKVVTENYLSAFMKAGNVGPKSVRDKHATNPM
jgi:uncharacterized protein YgiM (DUF1202 family)